MERKVNREIRRIELVNQLKACCQTPDMTAEFELYLSIMERVYLEQRQLGKMVTLDSLSHNYRLSEEVDSV